jgi:RNA polymerase sigma-70 factor, ECF subfamily
MAPEPSFDDLMARLRCGDAFAAAQVFHRFAHRLIALAQRRLDRFTRRKVDPEDVLQSVFRSFFVRHADGQFQLADWGSLWGILVVLTLRKCGRRIHHFRAACRNVGRETALSAGPSQDEGELLAEEPTPAEAAALADLVEQLLKRASPDDRPILTLCLDGFTHAEIATQVGCTERTVRRVVARARQRLQTHS